MSASDFVRGVLQLVHLSPSGTGELSGADISGAVSAQNAYLLGADALAQIEVSQWLAFALALYTKEAEVDSLDKADALLLLKTYLAGDALSIADVALALCLRDQPLGLNGRANLSRWFRLVDHALQLNCAPAITHAAPTLFFTTAAAAPQSPPSGPPSASATGLAEATKPVSTIATVAMNDNESKVVTAEVKSEKKKEKAPKEKVAKPVEEAVGAKEAVPTELNPTKLDIRVGVVLRCWEHPEADKLLCEEIDVGEETPRTIASGLRMHYRADEMVGRRVIVLANLKDRTMVGFKSQGMVLCAVNADHSVVKLVSPPLEAAPGDRVTFPGFDGAPASASEVAKKKVLEGLAPFMRTDATGVANWQGTPFTVAGGVCSSELADAAVS